MKYVNLLNICIFTSFVMSCGNSEVTEATFTSKVVQREICTETVSEEVAETDEETEPTIECARYEINHILRFKLIEDAEDRVWIQGWLIDGKAHRSWLGTRDQEGGFLFTRTVTTENEATGCSNVENQILSISFPDGISGFEDVGGVCTPMIGRETIVSTTSAGCNENELGNIRTINKRWEEDPTCDESVEISFTEAE